MNFINKVALFLYVFVLSSAFCTAQEPSAETKPLQPSAEVLALIEESKSFAGNLVNTEDKVLALLQILSLELRLPQKDAAKKTLQQIKELLPSIENGTVQNQISGALIEAMLATGDNAGAITFTAENPKVAGRSEKLLEIAAWIIVNNKNNKVQTDAVPVLQKAISCAADVKDALWEANAAAVLGSEYAKQGKNEKSKALFLQARNKSKELEEIEEREIVAMIVRLQLKNNLLTETYALIESLPADKKPLFYRFAAAVLAKEGKAEEAEKILKLLPDGDVKDNAMLEIASETIETISIEKLTQFINSVSKPEQKANFLYELLPFLAQKGRLDDIKKLSLLAVHPDETDEIITAANVLRIKMLMQEKKFDEADKIAAAIPDEQNKPDVLRTIIYLRIENGDMEKGIALSESILTEDEKKASAELLAQLPKVAEIEEPRERIMMYRGILESQCNNLLDLKGAKETVALILKNIPSVKDPVERTGHQLAVVGVQTLFNDKQGAAENMQSLVQFLAGIKDITVLKGFVPEEQSQQNPAENPSGNQLLLDLKKPVSEDDIRVKLLEIYFSAAEMQLNIGDFDGGKKTLAAIKQQIDLLKDSSSRIQMILALAQGESEFASQKFESRKLDGNILNPKE